MGHELNVTKEDLKEEISEFFSHHRKPSWLKLLIKNDKHFISLPYFKI